MHTEEKNESGLLPLAYFARKIFRPLLTVLLSALTLYFAFYFLIGGIAKSVAIVSRAGGTEKNEAVISTAPVNDSEYFYLLNGKERIALSGERRMNCDLLMAESNTSYTDNYVGFIGTLGEGECAVSRNLLSLYGLSVGEVITLRDRDTEWRISAATPAVAGIDEKYLHEGFVILGYSPSVAADNPDTYLSFAKDANGYVGLESFISVDKLAATARESATASLSLLLVISLMIIILWELLIGRRDYKNFGLLSLLGMRPKTLYLRIFLHLARGYLLPAAAVGIFYYFFNYEAYRADYLIPFAIYLAVYLVLALGVAHIIYRRVSVCKMRKRRS